MRRVGTIASFAARHAIALAVVVALSCAVWTVVYFALLFWAAFSGAGLGGAVAYPAGLVFVSCAITAAALFLFLPATFSGELLCRWRRWPTLTGIPLTFGFYCVLSLAWSLVAHVLHWVEEVSVWTFALGLVLTLALPLGLYWWTAEFPHVLREAVIVVKGRLANRQSVK